MIKSIIKSQSKKVSSVLYQLKYYLNGILESNYKTKYALLACSANQSLKPSMKQVTT